MCRGILKMICAQEIRRKEDRHPLQVIASFSGIKYYQNPHRPLEWFDTLVNKILLKNSAMWRDDDIRSSHCGRSSGEQTSAIKVSSWILELIPGKFHSKHQLKYHFGSWCLPDLSTAKMSGLSTGNENVLRSQCLKGFQVTSLLWKVFCRV